MKIDRYPCRPFLATAALSAMLCFVTTARTQQPPPVPPNPQAPVLGMAVPLGMQRGTTLELTLTGSNLADPTGLWTSFPAKVTIPTDANNGKDAGKLRVRLEVPKEAPLGFHSIRLATRRGLSNLRLFCIDDLPQVMEVDTNRAKTTPQALTVPCVVVGRADPEISDWYKISVKAGQRVSFDVLGRRLGSIFDPQITLYDAAMGTELPGGHSQDAPGLQTDPRLTYTFKVAGDYLIEVRDAINRGGPDFWYRLRVGDFPCATAPVPMAARRGSKVKVEFAGAMVEGVAPVEVMVPNDPQVDTVWVTPRGANGLSGWPVALAISDMDELVEKEPNNEPAQANRVTIPCGVTGRLREKGDVDNYVFTAKKGQRLLIEAHTLEFYTPSLMYMVLRDAKGAEVAKTNPQAAPPADQRIDYTPTADGDLTLEVQHLNGVGGPSEVYRITLTPYHPGFTLTLGLDRYNVAQGGTLTLPIFAVRRDYAGPIDLTVMASHPGITGTLTIKPGPPPPPNQPIAQLVLTVKPDVPLGPQTLWIQGKATINDKPVVEYVSVRGAVSQSLANLPFPPRQLNEQIGLAITERPPYTLAAKLDLPEAVPGLPAAMTVTATRAAGFDEEIVLTASGLPANVSAVLKNIPKGQNEVKIALTLAPKAALGKFAVTFAGKAKHEGKDLAVTAPPAALVVALPFELKLDAPTLKLAPGARGAVGGTIVRKGGYGGPIDVELRNLPANVTAAKVTVPAGKDKFSLDVEAAATAAVVTKADVNVLGTATAAANQQSASPNFTLSVAK